MKVETSGMRSYSDLIEDPRIDRAKITLDLLATPTLQEYQEPLWAAKVGLIKSANNIIPYIDPELITTLSNLGNPDSKDKPAGIFNVIQVCLYPDLATQMAKTLPVTDSLQPYNLPFMIAAAHIGVSKMAGFYTGAEEKERELIAGYMKYFAAAQAMLLGIKTSTTVMALYPEDKGMLRTENIAVVTEAKDDDDLKLQRIKTIFNGGRTSELKDLGGNDHFFFLF